MNFFYPDNLPIVKHKQTIIDTIVQHQVVVIAGDTGSGKTTQLPKMCLEAFPENELLIGCTQPRRIAASTVAARVAEELGETGDTVGYKIRFHDYTTPFTRIKFMTDGVLLAETRQDRHLSQYGVLIIDEAHERSLNIDFLLGYIKQLLRRRKDLKVIITSATIDTQSFSKHFNDAPVISVSGRSYPVTVRYLPPEEEDSNEKNGTLEHCIQAVCDLFATEPRGDILVFLPTERDIRDCCQQLERKISEAVVLPIFGRLPAADQRRIFKNFNQVKIVVATNVAETSVTVPGIRYVVDSGFARISYYNVRAKTTSLPVSRISQASCDQRKGRCGRIAPGICIRLYSEEDFLDRPEYTLPELKRSNLAEVILQMVSLKLGDPEKFPFLDPPHKNAIREGYKLLRELGAINGRIQLTKRGRIMADLPIDPCIARIIIEAKENNCLREIKIISAVLAIQDPRIRPADKEKEADTAHRKFSHPDSDFMVLMNIWNQFHTTESSTQSWSKLKKYCSTHFLSFQRMREWFDLHQQLSRIIDRRDGYEDNASDASYEQIHKSFLAGFLRNLARKKQGHLYQGTHNKELMIFPGSHQFTNGGQWLVAASFIETNRLYALTVATIQPEWIESVAQHLCKYSWSSPHWQKKNGQIIADERVSLFGLIIITGRKVNFGKRHQKNIDEARDIFIQSALVAGELKGSYPFLDHNLALIKKWQEAEEKLRVRDIVCDELSLYGFYDQRIPADIYDQASFNRFQKKKRNTSFLLMQDDDVVRRKPQEKELFDFPLTLSLGSMQVRLEYHFEPGSERDGVTFRLPFDFAGIVSPDVFEWLVPGLLEEKLTFLLKALPKNIRKKMVPISATVSRLLDDIHPGSGSLYSSLEASILKHFKLLIRRSDWSDNLPLHLQPRFLLFDNSGKVLCSGRNLKELLASKDIVEIPSQDATLGEAGQKLVNKWDGTTHSTWNFTGLPDTILTYTLKGEVTGFLYPVLNAQPEKNCVRISFDKDKKKAEQLNKKGTLFLYTLQFATQYRALKKMITTTLSGPSALWLMHIGKTRKEVVDEVLYCILWKLFGPLPEGIIDKTTFCTTIDDIKNRGLYAAGQEICHDLMNLVRKKRAVQEAIRKVFSKKSDTSLYPVGKEADFSAHLDEIIPVDIFSGSEPIPIHNLDRQLQSLTIRLDRFQSNPGKDDQKAEQVRPYLETLQRFVGKKNELSDEALEQVFRYRDLVNEFKISIFSPEIKTLEPVSPKKLNKQLEIVQSKC
ncbi:MAG: ATP-dependent RNA helicase HrpA [Desulforhopalus sp.]